MIISKRFRIMIYKFYKTLIFMTVSVFFTTQAFSETKLLGTEKNWKAYSTKIDKTKPVLLHLNQ